MLLLLCDVNSPNAESTEPSEGQKMACFLCCLAIAREGCRVLMWRIPRPVLPTTQTLCPVQPKMRDGPHAPKPIQVSQCVRHVGIRNFLWRWGSEQKVFVLSVTRLSTCCSSLYSWILLFIHPTRKSLHLLTPTSHSILPPALSPLATNSLISVSLNEPLFKKFETMLLNFFPRRLCGYRGCRQL